MVKAALELARKCGAIAREVRGLAFDLGNHQQGDISSADIVDLMELALVLKRLQKYLVFGYPQVPPDPRYGPNVHLDDTLAGEDDD